MSELIRKIKLYDITNTCDNNTQSVINYIKTIIDTMDSYNVIDNKSQRLFKKDNENIMIYNSKSNILFVDYYTLGDVSDTCKIDFFDILYIMKYFMKPILNVNNFGIEEAYTLSISKYEI